MLKRVKIQGYKSLLDVEVNLQPLSVLFGPNATGKSNFLDALQLLSRIATSTRLKDAFAPPYRGTPLESFAFGPEGIPSLLAQEKASFSIEVDVEIAPAILDSINNKRWRFLEDFAENASSLNPLEHRYLRYYIKVEILSKRGILTVADESLVALNDQGESIGESLMPPRDYAPRSYPNRQSYSASNDSVLSIANFALGNPTFHYPYLTAMREELVSWFFFYLEPRERMRIPTPVKEVRHIGLMGEEISAFLNTLQALDEPQFKAVEKALHLLIPSITGIDISVDNSGNVALQLMQGQTPIPASLLSEGTLRILGLLALSGAKEAPTLLGFEEPEIGIHPNRLDLVAILLKTLADGGTQVIVTTHSPTLLDLLPESSLYMFQRNKDTTSIDSFSNWKAKKHKSRTRKTTNREDASVSELLLRGDLYA